MVDVGHLPPLMLPRGCGEGLQAAAEAHVWLLDSRELDLRGLTGWSAALLGEQEQRRADALASPETRRDHLVGRIALRLLLSAYCPEVAPDRWLVSRAAGGRPMVSAPRSVVAAIPSFSISHSGGYLALAFHASGEAGVDIESASRRIDMMGLARRYFSAAEVVMLEALSGEALRAGFLRCWTLKEASVKADGAGLAGELERRCFRCVRGGRVLTESPDERRWQYWSWRWPPGRLAVALRLPAGWHGTPVACRPFTLSLPDGCMEAANVSDAYASAVV
jgi:4'-phosphopantetheinyl transferase